MNRDLGRDVADQNDAAAFPYAIDGCPDRGRVADGFDHHIRTNPTGELQNFLTQSRSRSQNRCRAEFLAQAQPSFVQISDKHTRAT